MPQVFVDIIRWYRGAFLLYEGETWTGSPLTGLLVLVLLYKGGWVERWWWYLSSMPLSLQVGGLAFFGPTHWRWLLWQYKPDLGRNWFGHLGEIVLCDYLLSGICSVYLCPLCVKLVWTTCWWPSLNADSQLRIHHGYCGRVSLFYLKGREGCLTSWFLVVFFEGHDSCRIDGKETLF